MPVNKNVTMEFGSFLKRSSEKQVYQARSNLGLKISLNVGEVKFVIRCRLRFGTFRTRNRTLFRLVLYFDEAYVNHVHAAWLGRHFHRSPKPFCFCLGNPIAMKTLILFHRRAQFKKDCDGYTGIVKHNNTVLQKQLFV